MTRAVFLVDTSALARTRQPPVADALSQYAIRGSVAISAPVMFEVGYAARSAADRVRIIDGLAEFDYVDTVEADHRRAIEVQSVLAETSRHRGLSLVDALVAAAAERTGLVVLHYDRDFERIAQVTSQPQAWVVPPGSAD